MTEMDRSEYPYVWLVSYAHSKGFGNIEMFSALPYRSIDEIRECEKQIAALGVSSVAVLNVVLLSGPDDQASRIINSDSRNDE